MGARKANGCLLLQNDSTIHYFIDRCFACIRNPAADEAFNGWCGSGGCSAAMRARARRSLLATRHVHERDWRAPRGSAPGAAGFAEGHDPHPGRVILEALGLTGEEDPATFSGGEARRCALARVLGQNAAAGNN